MQKNIKLNIITHTKYFSFEDSYERMMTIGQVINTFFEEISIKKYQNNYHKWKILKQKILDNQTGNTKFSGSEDEIIESFFYKNFKLSDEFLSNLRLHDQISFECFNVKNELASELLDFILIQNEIAIILIDRTFIKENDLRLQFGICDIDFIYYMQKSIAKRGCIF